MIICCCFSVSANDTLKVKRLQTVICTLYSHNNDDCNNVVIFAMMLLMMANNNSEKSFTKFIFLVLHFIFNKKTQQTIANEFVYSGLKFESV